jgi:hypothetical protein
MSIENLTHAEYIFLAYGATFAVLLMVLAQGWYAFCAARRALQDAGFAADEKARG